MFEILIHLLHVYLIIRQLLLILVIIYY